MAGSLGTFIDRLRRAVGPEGGSGLTDAELLERFVRSGDQAAFEVLVWRHGPTVLGVCRRLLRQEQDAEDAFQATFLTLARKAGSVRNGAALGAWLHQVACRAALLARAEAARRPRTGALVEDTLAGPAAPDPQWRDLWAVLDEEVSRLPDRYRVPFVLCHLEGKTGREAAALLGCPAGTVACRLSRACQRLRTRLARRGVTLSAAALAGLAADRATALPAALAVAAAQTALPGGVGAVSSGAAVLAAGVLKTLRLARLRAVGAVLLAVGLLTAAGGVAAYHLRPQDPDRPPATAAADAPPRAFQPVQKAWLRKVTYLKPDKLDPPNSFEVIAPKDRDPGFRQYHKDISYYEKAEDSKPRRSYRYHPTGYLETEIDNVGQEQFSRSLRPDGSVRSYLHWRAGKWLEGYSTSPDGKHKHRLTEGDGELVSYGSKQGDRIHRWYSRGDNFLDKRYRDGRCVEVRLNCGDDWLIAARDGTERLLLTARKEIWQKTPGSGVWLQEFDKEPGFERDQNCIAQWQKEYPRRRAAFLKRYGTLLREAGHTWEGLQIDFLRTGAAWPD
jgi:RNA polymerase sigma factor (sigma-70 family)